jgi:hypothetical protein
VKSVPTFFLVAFGLTIALLKRDYEKRRKAAESASVP